ncbi:hypothetical protein [Lactiplantibacillus pentosus]|nr:hypothetical protein [Lactiplantibacillus pentosus]
MNRYDKWLEIQEEQFEDPDGDKPTKDELIEAGVIADEEDNDD